MSFSRWSEPDTRPRAVPPLNSPRTAPTTPRGASAADTSAPQTPRGQAEPATPRTSRLRTGSGVDAATESRSRQRPQTSDARTPSQLATPHSRPLANKASQARSSPAPLSDRVAAKQPLSTAAQQNASRTKLGMTSAKHGPGGTPSTPRTRTAAHQAVSDALRPNTPPTDRIAAIHPRSARPSTPATAPTAGRQTTQRPATTPTTTANTGQQTAHRPGTITQSPALTPRRTGGPVKQSPPCTRHTVKAGQSGGNKQQAGVPSCTTISPFCQPCCKASSAFKPGQPSEANQDWQSASLAQGGASIGHWLCKGEYWADRQGGQPAPKVTSGSAFQSAHRPAMGSLMERTVPAPAAGGPASPQSPSSAPAKGPQLMDTSSPHASDRPRVNGPRPIRESGDWLSGAGVDTSDWQALYGLSNSQEADWLDPRESSAFEAFEAPPDLQQEFGRMQLRSGHSYRRPDQEQVAAPQGMGQACAAEPQGFSSEIIGETESPTIAAHEAPSMTGSPTFAAREAGPRGRSRSLHDRAQAGRKKSIVQFCWPDDKKAPRHELPKAVGSNDTMLCSWFS
ncbi:hypothetical protein WJX73_001768 [Symbiochloris irregularis]|uniref:Uncharacterized protein n=1 Tax=Symbiochloris irregularis TaxID=706552 RepID=A0AAW1P8T2_9CHLO